MESILKQLEIINTVVPAFVHTFNILASAIEHIAVRLAILSFAIYGAIKAFGFH